MAASDGAPLQMWLPALGRFTPEHALRRLLRRADRLADGTIGYQARLAQGFGLHAQALPAAALTRQWYAGDAGQALWLCADPAWVQPDMNGARLLATGQLQLSGEEAELLAGSLRAVVEDAGLELLISSPDRWHLRLPHHAEPLPDFAPPEQALGEDLFQHVPQGEAGRPWRVLLNDIQVLLHQHPLNQRRRAQGLPPVNHLWLWGAGRLPAALASAWSGVISDEPLCVALAAQAGIAGLPCSAATVAAARAGWLVDLQDKPVPSIDDAFSAAIHTAMKNGPVELIFAGGERWLHRPWHRLRWWRGGRA